MEGKNINPRIKRAANYLASQMPSADRKQANPVETLSVEDITYLQAYLQKIKKQKEAGKPCSYRQPETGLSPCRGMQAPTKSSPNDNFGTTNDYYNPYEYGSRQNQMGQLYKPLYHDSYVNDPEMLDKMGVQGEMYCETFPGQIRNVNLESPLLQKEMTRLPGQRRLTEKEIDRFELLPFDPQDPRHIVWMDMPRGGYPTRADRLEY